MSVTFGFYNSVNHDRRYNALQMSSIFDGIIKDGIFMSIGTALVVKASSGMTVNVGEGRAWFDHTWTLNDSELPVKLEASELILNRIDTIVLDVDHQDSVRANSIIAIKGTPATNPVAPTLVRSTDHNQYPLCNIYVKAGVTEITQSNITNLVGTGSCPFITGILDTIDIEDLVSQWEAQWTEFYNAQTLDMQLTADEWKKQWNDWFTVQTATATGAMEDWMRDRQADFDYWWSQIQAVLDGDVAANLAQRVLKLEENFGILATEFKVYHNLLDSDADTIQDSNGDNIETQVIFVTK